MANRKLGIDVEIKYPTAKQIGDEITKKWKEVKNRDDMELKVKIAPDGNSIRSFKSDIQKYIDNNPIKIKTEWDFVHARKGLKEIDQEFANLKRQMQKGLKVNFDLDAGKGVGLIFENAESKAKQLNTTVKNVGGTIQELSKAESSSGFGGFTSAINSANELLETNKKLESSFKQVTEEYVNGELKATSTTQDKLSALRQIVDVQKQINNLNSAKVGETNSATLEAYTKQIQNLESYMGDLKSDFKEVFGTDPNSEWLVRNTQAVGEMNVELRESKFAQEEVNEGFRRAVTILNEQYEVQKRMETAGEGEKVALQAKLTALENAYTETMKMKGLEEQMSEVQRTSLDMARQENAMNLEISRQKQNDLEIARQQKEEFRQLKTDRKEIYNIEKKISDLLAKDNYVTEQGTEMSLLNSKEKERLESLKNQLDVKKQAYDMSKKESTVSQESVSKMEQHYDALVKGNREIAEKNAKLEHSKSLYDKIQASIREQNRLSQKTVTAGEREESTLRDQIRLEEQKQNEIRDSIKSQNLMNDARERELSSMKKVQAEQDELNGKLKEASRIDDANAPTKDGNIFGFRIDPMRVASEARQAFQAVHNSVATIDSAMVDIAKVTEAPQAQLDEFSSQIYESASEVGLATEDYLGSVERWVTAGYTLQESQELGQLSAMGSFVGNIGEQDMVDYMSVPLIAFKDNGLEATDVLNVMNEVANKTAVEMEHLGQAYKTSAGTASTAGTSFAELTGLIAGAQEATRRGGDVIGRSLKATDINFSKFYANLTPADETKFNFFENIGVSLQDSNGELRSTYAILEELSRVWDTLSAEDQSTALFYAGGKQHASTLQGIITNWNGVAKATEYATQQMALFDKEGGSAFKEFEVQQDSVQFKTVALKNAWAEFLNTISGGKEGVNSILDLLTKIVKMGTKIASNDKAMKAITMIASATLWATATTLVNGFFGAITKGALQSFSGLKDLSGLFKGFGAGKGVAMANAGSSLAKVATSAGTTAVATGKATGAISMMTGVIGKAIPIVSALGTAYLTAELVASLFGTSLKEIAVDKLGMFKKKTGETATELEKFTKANEDYAKSLESNDLHNGSLKDVQRVIDKYNDLNKAKREAEKNGEGAFAYSKDEFQVLQNDLAMLSEQLGVDLKITYNGEENILEVLDTAQGLLKTRENKGANDFIVDTAKRDKDFRNLDTDKIYQDEVNRIKKEFEKERLDNLEYSKYLPGGQKEYLRKAQEEERRALDKFMQEKHTFLQGTKEYDEIAKQRKEAVINHKGDYANLIDIAPNLDVQGLSPNEAESMAGNLLSTAQYTRDVDETYASIIKKVSEGSTLTEKEMRMVESLNSEFVGVNTNTSTWADTIGQDAVNALGEVIDRNRESLAVDSEVTDGVIKNLLLQSGVSEQVADEMIAKARSSKAEYINLMGEMGVSGELALGVTQQALDTYGDKWSEVMAQVQAKIDILDDEVVTKYNLETEDGLANWDVITTVTNELPESVVTKYELIDVDGSINVENIVAMLGEIDDTKMTEWGLKDETGNFDWEAYGRIMGTPEEIATLFGLYKADGSFDIDTLDKLFKGIPDEKMVELGMDIDESGIVTLDEFADSLGKLEGEKVTELLLESSYYNQAVNQAVDDAKEKMREIDETTSMPSIDMRDTPFNEKREGIRRTMEELNFDTSTPSILADSTVFAEKEQNVKLGLRMLGDTSSTSEMKGDNTDAIGKKEQTKTAVESLDGKSSTVVMKGNNSEAVTAIDTVDEKIRKPRSFIVSIGASISNTFSRAMNAIGLGGSVAISPSVSIGGASASTPIVGRSFSAGVSSSIPLQSSSLSKSTSSKERPTTVDENVWRYWSKELFSGLPLERSMADLSRTIKKADDNYEKMIPLYRQQLSLIDKQIKYEQSMQRAQQSEMNSVLSQLRREGFKTSGNKITNLGIAKGMSGDKADRVNPLLTKYKSLYESIDGLRDTVANLKMDKWNTENSIKDAQEKIRLEKIAKELEKIEKTISQSEAVVKVISNNLDIFATKLGYISDSDFELQLSVNEEGVNKSAGALGKLIAEFNKLSKQAIGDPDNAEKMLSHLDSLKDSILGNADAVLEYKEAMKQIEIDRFVSDFDMFSETMDKNIGRLGANIETLKSGLLSGQSMGDLYSSSFVSFDPQRKTGIEKAYQDRLNLEEKLNVALDTFAKKNVDRAKKVANSTLQIEAKKYANLLQMQNDYTNGKVSTPTISNVATGIGITTAQSSSKDKEYQAWLSKLGKINSSYEKAYANMVSKFDVAMKKAKNASEKEIITNDMIIGQLELQESMYKDIIEVNNMAIANAKKMMSDSSLTTEQIEALKAEIEKYEEANISAQEAIKDSVTSRYDLEMDLIDKTLDKAKEYSDELGKMLDIAEAVGSSDEVMAKMYEAIHKGKLNEFSQSAEVLKKLNAEQAKLSEGSYEWGILAEKIKDVESSMSDLTLEILNSNKDILDNELDRIKKSSEKLSLNGSTLDAFKKYRDTWISGVEKEIELEKLRLRLASTEDKSLQAKLEMLDRQEAISKSELDYMDKQLSVIELQEKLNNINSQRNVQTLGKDVNGNWEWQYVADQTEYDKTNQELQDAQIELEKYKEEQKIAYVEEMNDIISKVKDGDYSSEAELVADIAKIKDVFDGVIAGDVDLYDTNAILEAYRRYTSSNQDIVSGQTGGMTDSYSQLLESVGSQFEKSFLTIGAELGKIIGEELRNALKSPSSKELHGGQVYEIKNQYLEFPNVVDASGIEEVFRDLPQIVKQMDSSK